MRLDPAQFIQCLAKPSRADAKRGPAINDLVDNVVFCWVLPQHATTQLGPTFFYVQKLASRTRAQQFDPNKKHKTVVTGDLWWFLSPFFFFVLRRWPWNAPSGWKTAASWNPTPAPRSRDGCVTTKTTGPMSRCQAKSEIRTGTNDEKCLFKGPKSTIFNLGNFLGDEKQIETRWHSAGGCFFSNVLLVMFCWVLKGVFVKRVLLMGFIDEHWHWAFLAPVSNRGHGGLAIQPWCLRLATYTMNLETSWTSSFQKLQKSWFSCSSRNKLSFQEFQGRSAARQMNKNWVRLGWNLSWQQCNIM